MSQNNSGKEAKHFSYSILGDSWTIYKVHEDDNVIMEKEAEAETNLDLKEIYFKDVNLDAVIHEISHIYFRGIYIRYTNHMNASDMEEICVALIADRGKLILSQADDIYTKLKGL